MNLKRSEQMKTRWRENRIPIGRTEGCDYCGGRVRVLKALGRYCFDCKIDPTWKLTPAKILAAMQMRSASNKSKQTPGA